MQQLYPEPATITPIEAYQPRTETLLRANMVASLDGAVQVDGRVGALTAPTDQEILWTLRAQSEVVLVGAGTVRAEGYRSLQLPDDFPALTKRYGDQPDRPLAIVSNSGRLDADSRAFTEARTAPFLIVPAAAELSDGLHRRIEDGTARLITAGDDTVDLPAAVEALRAQGYRQILSEGGPGVLGALLAEDLVDELCLTTSPIAVLGDGSRLAHRGQPIKQHFSLQHLLLHDDSLFARWRRQRD